MHPIDLAVREGVANQFQFLLADAGELLGNGLDRAVELAEHPAVLPGFGMEFGDVTLAPPQLHQPLQPFGNRARSDLLAVVLGLLAGLPLEQLFHHAAGQVGGHRAEEPQGEVLAAVGEMPASTGGESPAVAGPALALAGWTGLDQSLFF